MQQQFTILISASPLKTQSHLTAIKFIEEMVAQKQTVSAVFFYQDAVSVADNYRSPPSDEPQLINDWVELTKKTGIELQTCVAASFRRGLLDMQQAKESDLECNLNEHFNITGLGQLAAAMSKKNSKLIHFK